ncbi:MAG TPA: sulfur carrier protein ThiS [Phycisphaerae bacterium]|nr:sulfur carrier protein ThiS [Phycisphaerae bacterium]
MQVVINGKDEQIDAGTTVARLLEGLAMPPQKVAVEVNRELVTRRTFAETVLNEGDRIEIVTFVGGG